MKRLIVTLLLAAVVFATIWALTAALPLGDGTVESGSNSLGRDWGGGWNSAGWGAFEYFGPP